DGQIIDDAIAMLGQLEVDLAGATPIGHVEPVVEPVGAAEDYAEVYVGEDPDGADDPTTDGVRDQRASTGGAPQSIPGDDSDTAELRADELRVPDYQRRAVPRGHDDTPTVQLPPQARTED
ncbi:hypothetical protein, partial [Ruania albidiflava]|uniref:hypothetical protein n=1 Tax=Ruania albidiflava TaxID=366586 RepID=UPI0023F33413